MKFHRQPNYPLVIEIRTVVAHRETKDWKGYEETFWMKEMSYVLIKVMVYMVVYSCQTH